VTERPGRTVAAFDFDGTITRSDTMLVFLVRSLGWRPVVAALVTQSPSITRAVVGGASRDTAKEALFRRLLAGRPLAPLEEAAEAFADHLLAGRLRQDTLERISDHRTAGHELVVVSASPELWVGPVARRLGFTATLATRLEVGSDGCLTGGLVGRNCRGPEKVQRLREWLGDDEATLLAYGDSAGDSEMLAFAGEGGLRLHRERGRRRR